MKLNLFKNINEHFSIRLFVVFGIMAFLISGFFTGFYLIHQSRWLNTTMIKKGLFQVEVLAHNCRIGVFSENVEFLKDPVASAFHQDEVQEAMVFNMDGRLLKKLERTGKGTANGFDKGGKAANDEIVKKIRETMRPFYLEDRKGFEFWAPILSTSNYDMQKAMGLDEVPVKKSGGIIGFAMLRIGKEILNRQLKQLLVTSIVMLIIFLLFAFFISYFLAKGISKPLNRLIDGVNAIGRGMVAEKISVETKDEIGMLADSFNDMAESLKRREDEVKTVNQELMKQHEQRKMLSKRLIDLLEKDREQVAMELHDHIGQILTSLKINLEIIQGQLETGNSNMALRIKEAKQRAVQAMRDIKQISRGLKPSVLDTLGLVSSLRELLNDFETNTGIDIKFFTHEIPAKLEKEKELAIYRITQEALNNIVKHTCASTVFVSLVVKEGKISLSIEDNGAGFDPEKTMEPANRQSPFGLLIMRERVEQLHGEFSIESEKERGTYLLVEIPI